MNSYILLHIFIAVIVSCSAADDAGLVNPCQRECDENGPARVCSYIFHIEYYFTMSKACFDCPFNTTDCARHHCVAADGVERGIVVINRTLPGPSIQVCQGDRIVVDVKNHLPGDTTTIHWHGIHMKNTPYMDGVPLVTQCPISPASTFRYNFLAENAGTHFYHSHSEFQRADGVFGSLIVRQSRSKDPHSSLYDMDLPEHVILVSDWIDQLGAAKFVAHHHDDGDNKASSMIINGRGRIPKPRKELTPEQLMPLSLFNVTKGLSYRFRMISNGFLNCPIQLSVDNHTLLVIASDGNPVQPVEVDSLVIDAGERFDFVLRANQTVSTYWIRLHGLMDCFHKRVFQAALLRYQGAPNTEPEDELTYENTVRPGKILNPVNLAPGNEDQVTVAELKALTAEANQSWAGEPDRKFILAYDFYSIDNKEFHDPEFYPLFGVEKHHRLFTPQLNHISLKMPSSPPLSQYDVIKPETLCNESSMMTNCSKEFCHCTYTLQIPLGSLVELILIDEGVTFDATHPFHLHGSDFRVVAMERIGSSVTVNQIKELDKQGLIHRNLVDAPIKDTVAVPDGGFTIIRFVAKNPGYWLFHCHLSFHIEVGMGLIFKVGEHTDFPPVPKNFPKCGSWVPDVIEEEANKPILIPSQNEVIYLNGGGNNASNEILISYEEIERNRSSAEQQSTNSNSFFLDNLIVPHRLVNGSGSLFHSDAQYTSGSITHQSFLWWWKFFCAFTVLHYLR